MALSTSIKFNGKDIRATYGLEINLDDNLFAPTLEAKSLESIGRDGGNPQISPFKAKTVNLKGWMSAASHATLLTNLDSLKKEIGAGHHGKSQFRISFEDITDRYWLARLIDLKPMAPNPASRRTCEICNIELIIEIDQPFGIYNIQTFGNVSGSPFSSPFSCGYNYQGSAKSAPRIQLQNVGAADITSLALINMGIKGRDRRVAGSPTAIARATGRWNDIGGAASFVAASNPALSYPCQGNFNPGCFTIFMLVYQNTLTAGDLGYLFSTTSDTVRIYEKTNDRLVFHLNGNENEITHATSGFVGESWFAVYLSYDGTHVYGGIMNIADYAYHGFSGIATITYHGIPTNIYLGTDASAANGGNKRIDDVRLFNYKLSNDELLELAKMTGPLPMRRGESLYLPYDYDADGKAPQNTTLVITETISQNEIVELDCDNQTAKKLPATFSSDPDSIMDKVSGEFPFLTPGYNGIQVIHNGAASSVNVAIEDKRRFL